MFKNLLGKIKETTVFTSEIVNLQKKIKKYFKEFEKTVEVDKKGNIIINEKNEKEILEKLRNLIQKCIGEVDNLKSLNSQQKSAAKYKIKNNLLHTFKKEFPYFKRKSKDEIRKILGL